MFFKPNEKCLFEKQEGELLVQVIERGPRRELRFGNNIIQSAINIDVPHLLELDYIRGMAVGILFPEKPRNALHIGLGGGSLPRFLFQHLSGFQQLVVEISPAVLEAARQFFLLPKSPQLELINGEGEAFLKETNQTFDLIFLDAFHAEGSAKNTEQIAFYERIADRLSPGGWLVHNLWGSDQKRVADIHARMCECFPVFFSLSVRAGSNIIFFAGKHPKHPQFYEIKQRGIDFSGRLPLNFPELLKKLEREKPAPKSSGFRNLM